MKNARIAVVVVGILLPYLARIPGAITKGPDWIISYFGIGQGPIGFLVFGAFNAICWGSILAATFTYRKPRSVWLPAVLGFSFPAYVHSLVDLADVAAAGAMGPVIFTTIPILSLPLVILGWLFIARALWSLVPLPPVSQDALVRGDLPLRWGPLVYGAALALGPSLIIAAFVVPLVRQSLRAKRGLCPACGYDLHGAEHEACPECGWRREAEA